MSNDQLATERNRFIILSMLRIFGAVLVLFSLAIISRGFLDLPIELGYGLLFIGVGDFIVVPLLLANAWRSKPDL